MGKVEMSCDPGKCVVAHWCSEGLCDFYNREDIIEATHEVVSEIRHWIRRSLGRPDFLAREQRKEQLREILKTRNTRVILEEQGVTCFDYCPDCGHAVNWDAITVEYRRQR